MSRPTGDEVAQDAEDRRIHEDYKIWKKNAPLLYDYVLTHALDWPSLTLQWLPGAIVSDDKQYATHRVILGTHTSESESNYLMLADIKLPTEEAEVSANALNEETGELGGYTGSGSKFEIKVKITHEGEVNRARYCPGKENIIATKTPGADVLVFDWHKHPSRPTDETVKPLLRLQGHTKEGYGLAWSPHEPQRLLSASDDKSICMWDLAAQLPPAGGKGSGTTVAASVVLGGTSGIPGHTDVVEDVAWHASNPHIFGSVGDDKSLLLWDARDLSKGSAARILAHGGDAMSLSFNPMNEFLLATGGTDRLVKMWDSRSTKAPVHTFSSHTDDVLGVAWSPFAESVLASSSADRRVMIWDCGKIGQEQSEEDAEDGPPELLFVHGGHTARISDFGWALGDDWFMASTAEDNILQVWLPADNILYGEDDEEAGDGAAVAVGSGGGRGAGARAGAGSSAGVKRKVDDAELE